MHSRGRHDDAQQQHPSPPSVPADAAKGQELGRAGCLNPEDLLTLLRFIHENGYEKGSYEEWVRGHKNPA